MTKSPKTFFTSPKVYLRHPRADDFEELSERYCASRKHLQGLAPTVYNREKFDQMLAAAESDANDYFVICRVTDDVIVGNIHLSQIFRKAFQNAYLGYQLFAGYTGNGYMTQAVTQVLRVAFVDQKLHRVEANVQPHNFASIKVLERLGFTREGFSRRYLKIGGRWRDHERWAIIKEDWNNFKP